MEPQVEKSEEEVRAEIANEVFGGAEQSPQPEIQAVEAPIEPIEPVIPDKWAGVSADLRAEFEGLQAKIGGLEKIDGRLKQAESRLGAVTNELFAAKEAAKTVSQAPSKEQITDASSNQEDWDALKADWPEWSNATEKRISAMGADILKQMPNLETLSAELKSQSRAEITEAKNEMAGSLISMKHPTWKDTQASPEFLQWHSEQGMKNSFNPIEVIQIFDEFAAYQKNRKTPRMIATERAERLKLAENPQGRSLPAIKSEADMSESELRAAVAREVYG
jgi:hypothetical protein